jgi:hypothetical protein
MTWLLENPMPLVYLAAVVTAVLIVALVKTGQAKLIWAIVGVLVVTAIVALVSWLVETDREKIAATLAGGARAVENNDLGAFLEFVAVDSPVARRAKSQLPRLRFSKVTILDDPKIDVQQDQAKAAFNVIVVVNGLRGGRFVTVFFRRFGEKWLATDVRDENLNPQDFFR